jgi:hypothetical protein
VRVEEAEPAASQRSVDVVEPTRAGEVASGCPDRDVLVVLARACAADADGALAAADEDRVAHREADVVGVRRRLDVGLPLDRRDAVARPARLQLALEVLEEVVDHLRRGRGEAVLDAVGAAAPQRDLLESDEVRLRTADLTREQLRAGGEVRERTWSHSSWVLCSNSAWF